MNTKKLIVAGHMKVIVYPIIYKKLSVNDFAIMITFITYTF